MYTIGEFSKIGNVSAKMLRHYDSIGLLHPKTVNPENNYRYYSQDQVQVIMLINKLKRYRFSLKEISNMIHNLDTVRLEKEFTSKIMDLETTISDYAQLLIEMQLELNKLRKGLPIMESRTYKISVDTQEDIIVIASRQKTSMSNLGNIIGNCMEKVFKNHLRPSGPILINYYDKDFDPEDTEFEVKVPVNSELPGITTIHKGGLCAHTKFVGPYSELGYAYAALNDYIKDNKYTVSAAPYDVYLTTPSPILDPSEQITEVYFPIEKI